jgi:hypothetical protein
LCSRLWGTCTCSCSCSRLFVQDRSCLSSLPSCTQRRLAGTTMREAGSSHADIYFCAKVFAQQVVGLRISGAFRQSSSVESCNWSVGNSDWIAISDSTETSLGGLVVCSIRRRRSARHLAWPVRTRPDRTTGHTSSSNCFFHPFLLFGNTTFGEGVAVTAHFHPGAGITMLEGSSRALVSAMHPGKH